MPVLHVPLIPTLRARWRGVLFVWVALIVAAVAVSLALPPRYEATATVVVEMNGPTALASAAAGGGAGGGISAYVATQADIIRSEEVALGALRSLGLHRQPQWHGRWQESTEGHGDFEAWIAAQLLRKLAVRPSRESNAIRVSYVSREPDFSAAVVNAFVKSYMDTTLQMQVRPARQFNVFFEERAKPLREALEHARARLSAYEKQHGLLVGEARDVESARLAELTSQLVSIEDELADAANRRRQASSAPALQRELRRDPEVIALTAELARHEARLSELRSGFGEQHPGVIEARQALKVLQQRIDASMRRAAQSLDAPVKVNQARLAEVRAAIDRQRAVVLERKARRDAAAALVRDVENAQRAYDAVLARASQTALEKDNTTQTNVSVVKSATPPLRSSPLLVNSIVAAVLGLLLGIMWALFAESRDRRLRTIGDVLQQLQQPLLLVLPDADAERARSRRRSELTQQRLVSTQPRLAAPR